jgi:hypothetical protein
MCRNSEVHVRRAIAAPYASLVRVKLSAGLLRKRHRCRSFCVAAIADRSPRCTLMATSAASTYRYHPIADDSRVRACACECTCGMCIHTCECACECTCECTCRVVSISRWARCLFHKSARKWRTIWSKSGVCCLGRPPPYASRNARARGASHSTR